MQGVEIEPGGAGDPTGICSQPQRLRNRNSHPVRVTVQMRYQGEPRNALCAADWEAELDPIHLGPSGSAASVAQLGMARCMPHGSPCVEIRSWRILRVDRLATLPGPEPATKDIVIDADLAVVSMGFLVGKRPGDRLDLSFETFSADDVPLPVWQTGSIPGDQGQWAQLGSFVAGKTVKLEYRFRTGMQVPDQEVILGYFPNGRLTQATVFARLRLSPMTATTGTVEMLVKA